jgi:hypothetical protein
MHPLDQSVIEDPGIATPMGQALMSDISVKFQGLENLTVCDLAKRFLVFARQLEEVVDAIASVINGLNTADERLLHMQQTGMATALRLDRDQTKEALKRAYSLIANTNVRVTV